MAGVSYTIALDDIAVTDAFDRVAAAGADLFGLMDKVGRRLVAGARERIVQSNVTPAGVAWPKSLRATISGGPTLLQTSRLLDSIIASPEARQVTVGSNVIYAGVHQAGATIRPVNAKALSFALANGDSVTAGEVTIPARPYLGISEDEAADIGDITLAFFDGLLSRGGE